RDRAPQRAAADDERASAKQAPLALFADLPEENLSRIARVERLRFLAGARDADAPPVGVRTISACGSGLAGVAGGVRSRRVLAGRRGRDVRRHRTVTGPAMIGPAP